MTNETMSITTPLVPSESNNSHGTKNKDISWDDATWIMTCSFIIFTMQSGFALLESGYVSKKNEVNIMMKNAVDVIIGGLGYWMFGYGFSFGNSRGSNSFIGIGGFFLDADEKDMGVVFASYIFQLSFATTATTIVSGAMAERCHFKAYCLFSFFNTFVFCLPAGWVWNERGFLRSLNVVDIAGCSAVHLVGGSSALVAAIMLKPRLGRYDRGVSPVPMGSPGNALFGMFMLWWGWLGFNCGSTFGVSDHKWKYAARSAIVTINSSVGGGLAALIYSYIMHRKKFVVTDLINGILASLVAITAGCALYHPWEALIIGIIASLLCNCTAPLFDRLRIDDPVNAVSVHGIASIWGMLAVGLFVEQDSLMKLSYMESGLFRGGSGRLFGVQLLAVLTITTWSTAATFILFYVINKIIPFRMSPEEERAGADLVEHNIHYDYDLSAVFPKTDLVAINNLKLAIESSLSNKVENRKRPVVETLSCSTQTEIIEDAGIMSCCNPVPTHSKEEEEGREILSAWMSDDQKVKSGKRK